jgi:hypothetical protein
MFHFTPLRDRVLQMIISNPVPHRNTDIRSPYSFLGITLFFTKYKSVILNELYYKGLIELHGDVTLYIKAKSASETRYLRVEASVTRKGMNYYHSNISQSTSEVVQQTNYEYQRPKLSVVR